MLLILVFIFIHFAKSSRHSLFPFGQSYKPQLVLEVNQQQQQQQQSLHPHQLPSKIIASSLITTVPAFVIKFNCQTNVNQCSKINKGLNGLIQRMSPFFLLRQSVTINATAYPFCLNITSCALSGVIAQTQSGALFPARLNSSSPFYLYPSSLVKQLKLNQSVTLPQFDIQIEINSNEPFWFKQDNTTIQSHQIDFEFVIGHELNHGFGFETAWTTPMNMLSVQTTENLLIPYMSLTDTQVITWLPPTLFDSFMKTSGSPFTLFSDDIEKTVVKDQSFSTAIKSIQKNPKSRNAAVNAFNKATSTSILNLTTNTGQLFVESSQNFISGSSLCHVSSVYAKTPEFLMISSVNGLKGFTLDQIIARNAVKGSVGYDLYGPITLQFLTQMGWPTSLGTSQKSVEILMTVNANGGMISGIGNMLIIFVSVILLL